MAKWTGSDTETGKEQEKTKSVKGKDGVYYIADWMGKPTDKIDLEYYQSQPGYESYLKSSGTKSFNSANDVKGFEQFVANFEPPKGGGGKGNGMKIKGSGSGAGWKGDTLKINPKDAEFVGFNKLVTDDMLKDPGTKFSKPKHYEDLLEKIQSKHYDKDGNLVIPKFDKPGRVKLTKEQKKDNRKIDKQFNKKGEYKGALNIGRPELQDYNVRKKYTKAASSLADAMGIDMDRPSNGKQILKEQASRYKQKSGNLKIPDFGLDTIEGKKLRKKGKKHTYTAGIRGYD